VLPYHWKSQFQNTGKFRNCDGFGKSMVAVSKLQFWDSLNYLPVCPIGKK
jgi:hypothetical protein